MSLCCFACDTAAPLKLGGHDEFKEQSLFWQCSKQSSYYTRFYSVGGAEVPCMSSSGALVDKLDVVQKNAARIKYTLPRMSADEGEMSFCI